VSSIRVCRDAATRRSLGYAYVNFHNVADAERAIDTLNYQPVGGGEKPCRIMWSHRDPSLRRSGRGNIFIKNLDKSIDHKSLCDTFSAFGNILSCKVALDREGQSRGFGFVHFENPEAADAAIAQVNGMLLADRKVFVGHFQPNRKTPNGPAKFTNVFVKDLPLDVGDDELKALFAPHGEITSCVVQRKGDVSLGFGFVNYSNPDDARKAVETMNGADVKGKKLFVSRAQKKAERQEQLKRQFEERKQRLAESNVFVKNLDESVDDAKLREQFQAYGEIVSVKVMRDEKGVSKGFGFVCFSNAEEAHKAINDPANKNLAGKPLYVALAQRKEVRSAQLQAQYAHRQAGRGMQQTPMGPMFLMGHGVMPSQGRGQVGQGPYPGPGPYPQPMVGRQPQPRWAAQPGAPGGGRQQGGFPPGGLPGVQGVPRGPAQPGQYVINNNAANPIQGNAPVGVVPMGAPVPQMVEPAQPSLADLSEKDRKQVLGEFLYPKIESLLKGEVHGDPNETGKITGMLLESLDHGELVHLLESPAELKSRVEEAIQVLREHLAQQGH
jgi:polyadenylate-binding protein